MTSLDNNLLGAYLYGSIAFPEYNPAAGDIDFYIVVCRSLTGREINSLDRLHRSLAAKFPFGRKLDGFYIPLSSARRPADPKSLVCGAHGAIRRGGRDDSWALHREHFARAAYIRLYGPSASRIFPPVNWQETRRALYRQLAYARKIIDSDPWWSVLNLCRIVHSFATRGVAVSKLDAARWALKKLPSAWKPVIRSSLKTYKGTADRHDRAMLRRDSRKFLGFASIRVIAFDIASASRGKRTAHLRKTRSGTLR